MACIGVGGKGESDSTHAFEAGGNIVAICDVDANTLNKRDQSYRDRAAKENRTYDAKKYNDWRKMFLEMGKSIDAVTQQEAAIRKARILAWVNARRVLDDAQRKKVEAAAAKAKTK